MRLNRKVVLDIIKVNAKNLTINTRNEAQQGNSHRLRRIKDCLKVAFLLTHVEEKALLKGVRNEKVRVGGRRRCASTVAAFAAIVFNVEAFRKFTRKKWNFFSCRS